LKTIDAYWWKGKPNFGDALNPYIYKNFFNVDARWSYSPSDNTVAMIGSIIHLIKPGNIVYGAGCISPIDFIPNGLQIKAVRGPLTKMLLEYRGYDVPDILGDPSMLLPAIIPLKPTYKYKYGILPHYIDFDLAKSLEGIPEDSIFINPLDIVERIVDQIQSVDILISSSLHGIIMGEVYGKGTIWVKFQDKICGGRFKFDDFYQSIGKNKDPIIIDKIFHKNEIDRKAETQKPLKWNPDGLLRIIPFACEIEEQKLNKLREHYE